MCGGVGAEKPTDQSEPKVLVERRGVRRENNAQEAIDQREKSSGQGQFDRVEIVDELGGGLGELRNGFQEPR